MAATARRILVAILDARGERLAAGQGRRGGRAADAGSWRRALLPRRAQTRGAPRRQSQAPSRTRPRPPPAPLPGRCGHTPVALVGGATGRVGDPSGRSSERPVLSEAAIERNVAGEPGPLVAREEALSHPAPVSPGPAAAGGGAAAANPRHSARATHVPAPPACTPPPPLTPPHPLPRLPPGIRALLTTILERGTAAGAPTVQVRHPPPACRYIPLPRVPRRRGPARRAARGPALPPTPSLHVRERSAALICTDALPPRHTQPTNQPTNHTYKQPNIHTCNHTD